MWLKKLQVAIATKNIELLEKLMEDIPQLNSEDAQSAVILLEQANAMVQSLKDETARKMLQLRKSREFLLSSTSETISGFDTTS